MKLQTEFEDGLMLKYSHRGAEPIFAIYWTHGEAAYPEEGWVDFGSVILGWWLVAAESLVNGATEVDLPFMDGPFRMNIRRAPGFLSVSSIGMDEPWRLSEDQLVREILQASQRVKAKLAELGIKDTTGLEVGMNRLRIAVAQQSRRTSIHAVATQTRTITQ